MKLPANSFLLRQLSNDAIQTCFGANRGQPERGERMHNHAKLNIPTAVRRRAGAWRK